MSSSPILSRGRLAVALFWSLMLAGTAARAGEPQAKVYVIMWFDTEDYILPASDDAALRIARFLTRQGIRGTFKVVGEKARSLQRRGRTDVIEALKKHEIGYHSNWHSTQPSPALYLSDLGWDEGVAEFDRREKAGFDDVRRIFGTAPTCYGQPGSSWGPQAYGALRKWGVGVYLDYGTHVGIKGRPCYFGGLLNLYHLENTMRADLKSLPALKQAEEKFLAARKQILAEGGGVVSICYHPCEFIHQKFWDGVNFKGGANPPREQWKRPPVKSPEEIRTAFAVFENYVGFMQRFPDVRFVTASEALKLYRDRAQGRPFSPAELKAVAGGIGDAPTFQRREGYALAPSEVLALLNEYVAERGAGRTPAAVTLRGTPFGPSGPGPGLKEPVKTDWSQLTRTAADVADFIRKRGQVPTSVWLGSVRVPPEAYLRALAEITPGLVDGKPAPKEVEVRPARLATAVYVAEDGPQLWPWVIFPRGFRAPALMKLARLQAWTIKPALLDRPAAEPEPAEKEIRGAVGKALPLIRKGAAGHMAHRTCFACHNQAIPILALTTARARGFPVPDEEVQKHLRFIAKFLDGNRENYRKGRGQGGQVDTAGYALWTLETGGWKPDATTAAVAEYLLLHNKKLDHWRTTSDRPPSEASPFTTTYLAVRGLQANGTPEQKKRLEDRLGVVRGWLAKTPAKDTEDRVFRLWALKRVGADAGEVRAAARELIRSQRAGGGWAQLDGMKSADAYATGTALVALHRAAGLATDDPVYRRGVKYLLKTQLGDGSWHVRSRSHPFQTYFETGFPHGQDQFISIAASSWAATALALALPPNGTAAARR